MAVHPGRGSLCSDGVSHRHSFLTRNSSQTGVPGFRWPSVKAHPLPYVTTCDRGCQNCTKSFFLMYWLHCVFVAASRLSSVVASGGSSLVVVFRLPAVASLVVEHRL